MLRPWQIWLAFGGCLAVVLAAVGWLSFKALEADDAQAAAARQATLEESARLALWRMDSAMALLVAQESARPYVSYESFYTVDGAPATPVKGSVQPIAWVPSPLLVDAPFDVLLHFQMDRDGQLCSPRVPVGAFRNRAVPRYLSPTELRSSEQRLAGIQSLIQPKELWGALPAPEAVLTVSNLASGTSSLNALPGEAPNAVPQQPNAAPQQSYVQQSANGPAQQGSAQTDIQQQVRGFNEYQARTQYLAQNAQSSANWSRIDNAVPGIAPAAAMQGSVMKPLWVGGQLILARRVRMNGQEYVQGCLLDWPAIQRQLLAAIKDLLPEARLSAIAAENPQEQPHMLASLPVRLDLGTLSDAVAGAMSPVRLSLVGAWGAMFLAAAAVAALLRGVLSLSERRAAFVSAVTHELRTPLTTFRMYAEMLADGMVPDEASRHCYLETLRVEADRLTHLVENVLLYARLERGGPGGRIAPVAISQILDQATDRLADRARQADFELVVDRGEAARTCRVLADPSAVEQILFNLVDNACKYAANAADRTLHLETVVCGGRVGLRLGDHGPGIGDDQRRVLFKPFRKSARDAAYSAPGVGLGLALCRRLARDMGGDLSHEPDPLGGACFTLRLRAAGGNA